MAEYPRLKELKDSISKLLTTYFEKEIENVNWGDSADFETEIHSIIDELDEAVSEAITDAAKTIDDKLEDFSREKSPSFYEEQAMDAAWRENELAAETRWQR